MKKVDLRNEERVSSKYTGIPQPMYIYHSIEEFKEHVLPTNPIVIRNAGDFIEYLKKYDLVAKNTYANVYDSNVWIATDEKFVPESWTPEGVKIWKMVNNELVPTDNCFIRLVYLYSAKSNYMLFTSSGVYNVSMSKWNLSAAVKDQFLREMGKNPKGLTGKNYEENLKKYLARKKSTVRDVRVFHVLFNPFSEAYLKPDLAVKTVFGHTIKAKDRMKLYETERFKKIYLKEMRSLMPNLQQAFQDNIPDKEMVEMAKKMFNISLEKGTTEDQIKVYDMIYQMRESEAEREPAYQLTGNQPAQLNSPKEQGKPKEIVVESYDDADVVSQKKETAQGTKETEDELNELREQTGAISEYVNSTSESETE